MCVNVNHREEITEVSIFSSTTGYFKYQVVCWSRNKMSNVCML